MNHLKIEIKNHFCIVSLNRPQVKNAFHPQMIQEITDYFLSLSQQESSFKAVILKGEGTAFCAGADLAWMKDMVNYSESENVEDSKKLWAMFKAIEQCPIPVIGLIHGAVFGGALGLLACCDYVYAEIKTKFCFSEVKLGLIPAVISEFVFDKCAKSLVAPYMFSAEIFSADKAVAIGLCHHLYADSLSEEAIIEKWEANGPEAMKAFKKLIHMHPSDDYQKQSTLAISQRRVSREGQARLTEFLKTK